MFFKKIGKFFGKVVKGVTNVASNFFGLGGQVSGSAQGVNIIIPPELQRRYGPTSAGPVRVTPQFDFNILLWIGGGVAALFVLLKLLK